MNSLLALCFAVLPMLAHASCSLGPLLPMKYVLSNETDIVDWLVFRATVVREVRLPRRRELDSEPGMDVITMTDEVVLEDGSRVVTHMDMNGHPLGPSVIYPPEDTNNGNDLDEIMPVPVDIPASQTLPPIASIADEGHEWLNPDDYTEKPTRPPIKKPTRPPTFRPTRPPTKRPTRPPTLRPTKRPSDVDTPKAHVKAATRGPTKKPTRSPTQKPTRSPTKKPIHPPTKQPTRRPTLRPTKRPSPVATNEATRGPTKRPSKRPTSSPTKMPTQRPRIFNEGGSNEDVNYVVQIDKVYKGCTMKTGERILITTPFVCSVALLVNESYLFTLSPQDGSLQPLDAVAKAALGSRTVVTQQVPLRSTVPRLAWSRVSANDLAALHASKNSCPSV